MESLPALRRVRSGPCTTLPSIAFSSTLFLKKLDWNVCDIPDSNYDQPNRYVSLAYIPHSVFRAFNKESTKL
jgi:hypothetical protein